MSEQPRKLDVRSLVSARATVETMIRHMARYSGARRRPRLRSRADGARRNGEGATAASRDRSRVCVTRLSRIKRFISVGGAIAVSGSAPRFAPARPAPRSTCHAVRGRGSRSGVGGRGRRTGIEGRRRATRGIAAGGRTPSGACGRGGMRTPGDLPLRHDRGRGPRGPAGVNPSWGVSSSACPWPPWGRPCRRGRRRWSPPCCRRSTA